MSKSPHFKANARLKDIVGRELINDDNIAVAELVKNAIDADARQVDIVFNGLEDNTFRRNGQGRIIIADNGEGMNRNDIESKWLNIAYSAKRKPVPEKGFTAGNKGIGRFSCDRLGERLELRTRSKKGGAFMSMTIDWTKFEVDEPNKDIGSIDLDLRTIQQEDFRRGLPASISRGPLHGVILEMTGLRSDWDRNKILALRRLLEKMANPHEFMLANQECRIYVHAPEMDNFSRKTRRDASAKNKDLPKLTRVIKNRIFDKLDFEATTAESRITNDGERVETKILDQGRMVVKIVQDNPYPDLRNARISLHYMNRYKKAMFTRMMGTSTLEFGSVFLFLNGFRVPPYGDRGNDWLSLDNRKTQGTQRFLGTRDLLGRVGVSDPDGRHFRVVSSREGIVHNDAYRQLVNVDPDSSHTLYGGYIYDVLKRLEAYVVEGLNWDSLAAGVRDEEIKQTLDKGGEEHYKLGRSEKDLRILGALHKIAAPPERGKIIGVEIDPLLLPKLRKEEQQRAEKIVTYLGKLSDKGVLAVNQVQTLAKIRTEIQELVEKRNARIHAAEERVARAKENEEVERSKRLFYQAQLTPKTEEGLKMTHEISNRMITLKDNMGALNELLGNNAPSGAREILVGMRLDAEEVSTLCDYLVNRNFEDAYGKEVRDIPQFLRSRYAVRRERDKSIGKIRLPREGDTIFASKFSPMDLTIVLDNLLSNARKAAAVRFGPGRKPNIQMETFVDKKGQELVLRVSDDAGGLDPSIKNPENIFEARFTKTGGMGLGLHIARNIVEERLGGKIQCVPRAGGTTFEIRIPKR